MTGAELRDVMEGRGMTATDLGNLLGIHAVSVRRWVSGRYPVPRFMEYITELWEDASRHERERSCVIPGEG